MFFENRLWASKPEILRQPVAESEGTDGKGTVKN